MTVREEILRSIRARKPAPTGNIKKYIRVIEGDPVDRFVVCAEAANATVHILGAATDVPNCVSELLRARNLAATIHLPRDKSLKHFNWNPTEVLHTPPGPDDTAVAIASFGVAETGTLVFPASIERPASWHFRPAFEIAILRASDIVPDLETAFAKLRGPDWPHTINLVTGPSRTGDIEQTMELGAHGPKALAILLIRERPTA